MREHWITADLHLGHANISRYSGRPFSDPDDMDEAIVESWNTTVGPTDRVLVLGDVALGKITDSLSVSRRLHGHKILLPATTTAVPHSTARKRLAGRRAI
jgi:calcineurin-like phosphoesterase family protein